MYTKPSIRTVSATEVVETLGPAVALGSGITTVDEMTFDCTGGTEIREN